MAVACTFGVTKVCTDNSSAMPTAKTANGGFRDASEQQGHCDRGVPGRPISQHAGRGLPHRIDIG